MTPGNNSQFNAEKTLDEMQLSPVPFSGDTKKKLLAFRNGDITSLDGPETISLVAQYIYDLYHKGDLRYALLLLENLGEWSRDEKIMYRERSLMALSLITEKVLEEGNEDFLEALAHLLIRWLKRETEFLVGFEFICLQLRKIVERMLQLGLWYQSEDLIAVLHKIKKGHIKKNNILTQTVAKIHSHLAAKEFLEQLTKTYVDEKNDKRDVAGTLLVHFGDKAALHLLLALSSSPNKNERFQLIDLIPSTGPEAVPALIETLHTKPPWYVIRNIILIISRLSDPSLYEFVKVFLRHNDIRVQQEVIDCIRQMNGSRMVNRLLEALEICNDKLKPQIIRYLGPIKDTRIEKAFSGLFRKSNSFDRHIRDEILFEVCNQLPGHPSQDTVTALQNFLLEQTKRSAVAPEVLQHAENTLAALQEQVLLLKMKKTTPDREIPVKEEAKSEIIPALSHIDEEEEMQTESQEDSEEIVQSTGDNWNTFTYVEETEAKDTEQAEKEQVESSDLLRHKELRPELYQNFTENEFAAFSSYLIKKTCSKGDTLVALGDVQSNLFFIDSGEVQIVFPEEESISYIKPLTQGDIFGNDIFMSGSEWQLSLVAQSDAELFVFDQEQLLKMQLRFPELSLKILEYCKNRDVILSLFRMIENRRPSEQEIAKIPFTGNAGDSIADVEIIDLSSNGICFTLTLPKGFSHSLFADKSLTAFFSAEPQLKKEVDAEVVGLKFTESDNCRLIIFAKFIEPSDLSGFNCTRLSLY